MVMVMTLHSPLIVEIGSSQEIFEAETRGIMRRCGMGYVQSVNDSGDITKDCQENVDQKVGTTASL
jgi:hypothetical protein